MYWRRSPSLWTAGYHLKRKWQVLTGVLQQHHKWRFQFLTRKLTVVHIFIWIGYNRIFTAIAWTVTETIYVQRQQISYILMWINKASKLKWTDYRFTSWCFPYVYVYKSAVLLCSGYRQMYSATPGKILVKVLFKVVIENKTVISINIKLLVSFCNLLF